MQYVRVFLWFLFCLFVCLFLSWSSILFIFRVFTSLPLSEWIYWCYFKFLLVSCPHLLHHLIPSLWSPSFILINYSSPSILKCKRQAEIQVLWFFFLFFFPFLSSALSELGWLLKPLKIQDISVLLIFAFFGFIFIASSIPLKSKQSKLEWWQTSFTMV